MNTCNKCGANLREGAKFCSKCGTHIKIKLFCHQCGIELEPADQFCYACDASIQGNFMKIGYVRISTVEQNESRQLETMKLYGVEKIFSEKISAKNTQRPKLNELLDFAREGDTIYIHDFSRLARNTKDLLNIVENLNNKGIHLVSSKENIDTSTATGKLLLTVIAAISQFERENLRERQLEGIKIAKSKGLYKGRKPVKIDNFEHHYKRWRNNEISKTALAHELGISRQTLYSIFQKYENHSN